MLTSISIKVEVGLIEVVVQEIGVAGFQWRTSWT
jgi:hypothetical protein